MGGRRLLAMLAVAAACTIGLSGLPGSASGEAPPTPDPTVSVTASRDPGSSAKYQATLAAYAAQVVDWAPCYEGESPEFECAWIITPMDWAHPGKGDIELLITRVLATGQRRGILQTNPGGPGGAGYWMPFYLEQVEPEMAEHYDLIGMDPRGIYGSTTLECQGTDALEKLYALDGLDHSAANTAKFLRFSKAEADGCATDVLAPYINTDQTVRDLDLVRAIFGEQKTSYFGYSAGTWMGAWYATQFPSHVDRFVLDGNFNFTTTWYEGFRAQAAGFQRSFEEDLIPWLAKYDSVFHLGGTPAKVKRAYDSRRAQLARHPLTLTDGSTLTGAGFDFGISGGLYATYVYPDLGNALSILERYQTATPEEQDAVTAIFGNIPLDQSEHVFWNVTCTDTAPPSKARVFADWRTIGQRYPLTGSSYLGYPCDYYTVPAIGSPVTGRGIPPLLMLQNDGDPATPYGGALQAHRNTPGSVMVTVRDQGDHTIYGNGDECVEAIANDWLIHGKLPRRDQTCEGIPLPDPTASEARQAAATAAAGMPAQVWGDDFVAAHGTPTRSVP
jgi:pimeloyl-ACP methyl ester carboxylesterase